MIKILVVDDSHAQRENIVDILTPYKIVVTEAENGEEAQKKLKEEQFNLVITDLIMPKMNGYQLCRWIKEKSDRPKTPVIICSTKNEEFDLYWGKKQGADAYLTKPFQAKELLKLVKYILKHSQSKS
jgi:twitching motility two-component system response regulator PilH